MKVLRSPLTKITKATIDSVWKRRKPKQRLVIPDAEVRGLALVVNPTGMTWRFDFRPRGMDPETGKRPAMQSISIGSPASHDPDAARKAANALKGQAKAGTDLAVERKAKIAASAVHRSRTLERVVEAYAKGLPNRPSLRGTGRPTADYINREVSRVRAAIKDMNAQNKTITDLGAGDLRALLEATADQPGAARHRWGAVSRFLDWSLSEGLIAVNPCLTIGKERRPKPVPARALYLAPAQLARVWKAAGEAESLEPVHRDLIRIQIAVPCRRGEAASLRWEHLDLDGAVWVQPAELVKNRRDHRLPLPSLALRLLRDRHKAAGKPANGLVFRSPQLGEVLSTFSRMKRILTAKLPDLRDWRLHDTRRTFVSTLAEEGFAEPVLDALLNHAQAATRSGVLATYQKSVRWAEQQAAMERWNAILTADIDGKKPDAKVVPLHGKKRRA
ncbi:tyrosine-type recombinase/integrase [Neoroseomonas lacus]|uniref:Tyr recombinase domain-containing protein n=1 Tax=Neoroseomonas lacus TaxID=287609 RepID=A0A917KS57_9PROT|nr:site-specific integrase [Neoroseomonas lacus]GGJ25326.1 hypothetical protein GCM10011320_35910 [Neoroseomonas lacus]